MPRRGFIPKREVLADPIYNSMVVTKLIKQVMLDGKRGVKEVWPAALVIGGSFAVAQFLCATYFSYELTDIVASLGGSITAEHGVGRLRISEVSRYRSELEMEMMARLKRCFDPLNLMNPGKLLTREFVEGR